MQPSSVRVSPFTRVAISSVTLKRTDPDSPRLKKMIHDLYDSFDFPGENVYFGDLAIYIRR